MSCSVVDTVLLNCFSYINLLLLVETYLVETLADAENAACIIHNMRYRYLSLFHFCVMKTCIASVFMIISKPREA